MKVSGSLKSAHVVGSLLRVPVDEPRGERYRLKLWSSGLRNTFHCGAPEKYCSRPPTVRPKSKP